MKNGGNSTTKSNEVNETDDEMESVDRNLYNGYASITQTSFSGADKNATKTNDANNDNGIVKSPSTASISSFISQGSTNSVAQQTNSAEKSKAVRSLTDLLSLTG